MINNSVDGKWAVILCGGRGSRMGPVTDAIPKALAEVHGKPILWFIFWTLHNHGFRNFIFPLGYHGAQIESYMHSINDDSDCRITCIDTGEDTPIGLRIQQIREFIPDGEDFFLLNSDTIFDFDIEEMLNVHQESNSLLTLSSVEVVSIWGLIITDGDRLTGFDRQRKIRHLTSDDLPGKYGLINSGLAWLNKDALNEIDLNNCADFETELYKRIIEIGRASHYQIRGEWFPIDTPKDLNVINLTENDVHGRGHIAKAVHDKLATPKQTS